MLQVLKKANIIALDHSAVSILIGSRNIPLSRRKRDQQPRRRRRIITFDTEQPRHFWAKLHTDQTPGMRR
jgi:hypothetical protein